MKLDRSLIVALALVGALAALLTGHLEGPAFVGLVTLVGAGWFGPGSTPSAPAEAPPADDGELVAA